VLLQGQAIWYDKLQIPDNLGDRRPYGFQPSWIIYMCPQSIFKLMPEFDAAVIEILRRVPNSHVVFIEGRRLRWTNRFKTRLQRTINDDGFFQSRVHFVPRVPGSESFLRLISTADSEAQKLRPYVFQIAFNLYSHILRQDGIALGIPVVDVHGWRIHFTHIRKSWIVSRLMSTSTLQ